MLTESASIRAGKTEQVDRSALIDRPGEWRERQQRQLLGALRLIESFRERELSENEVEVDVQVEVDALKRRIAALQEKISTARKQSFMDTVQNKDLASADTNAAFSAPVDSVEDLG